MPREKINQVANLSIQMESTTATASFQMMSLIDELQKAELNKEAKDKTLETLNAITGMLESLRNNKLLQEGPRLSNHPKTQASSALNSAKGKEEETNVKLKQKFQVRSQS